MQGGDAVAGRTFGPSGLPYGGCPKVRVSTEAGSHGKGTGIPSRSGMSPRKKEFSWVTEGDARLGME